jgi:transketolase
MNRKDYRTFCIISDGENDEGQTWEAALFAAHWKLDSLVAICDYNKLQVDGFTHEILDLEPLVAKWEAFGWAVFEMDGHDWGSIAEAFRKAMAVKGKPAMVIAHTVKSKGHSLTENTAESHNIKVPDDAARQKYLACVEKAELPY